MKYLDIQLKYNSKRITLHFNIYTIHLPNTEMRTETKKYYNIRYVSYINNSYKNIMFPFLVKI